MICTNMFFEIVKSMKIVFNNSDSMFFVDKIITSISAAHFVLKINYSNKAYFIIQAQYESYLKQHKFLKSNSTKIIKTIDLSFCTSQWRWFG